MDKDLLDFLVSSMGDYSVFDRMSNEDLALLAQMMRSGESPYLDDGALKPYWIGVKQKLGISP